MAAKAAKAKANVGSKNNGNGQGSVRRKADFKGFAPDSLSESAKDHIKSNLLSSDQVLDWINNQTELGYKISFSYSHEAGFTAATAYGLWADMENGGVSLTARHSDIQIAVTTLCYLVDEVYNGGKWEETNNYDW